MAKVKIGTLRVDQCGIGILQQGNSEVEVTNNAEITRTGIAVLSVENMVGMSKIIELSMLFPHTDTEKIEKFLSEFKTIKDVNEENVLDKIIKYGLPITTNITTIVTAIIGCLPG